MKAAAKGAPTTGDPMASKEGQKRCADAGGACFWNQRFPQESRDSCKPEQLGLCGGEHTCCVLAYDVPIAPVGSGSGATKK